jgi:hypothetical protein
LALGRVTSLKVVETEAQVRSSSRFRFSKASILANKLNFSGLPQLRNRIDMLRSFNDPNYQHYSPFAIGSMATFMIYLGLILFAPSGVRIPSWLWFLGLPILIFGAILQLLSKRILWIRSYQAGVAILFASVYASLLWITLTHHQNWTNKLLAMLIIGLIVVGSAWSIYVHNLNSSHRKDMPHGPIGMLDSRTGIVDPTRSPVAIQKQWEQAEGKLKLVSRLAPLIAGISMFLVRILSEPGILVIIAVIALLGTIFGSIGIGGLVYYVFAIIRWEREHEKRMLLQ